ncbi:MAG: flagellar export chaperone FlgN [Thermoleophilaceae bacterium]
MTALAADPALALSVIRHLDAQLVSARRLLDLILRQGQAIRERDVETVLLRLSDVKTEMALREHLEQERTQIVTRAAGSLGTTPDGVTLEALATLLPQADAEHARSRSAELRGLLGEIAREHGINRALMRQELAFLDHLVRLIGAEPATGYAPTKPESATVHRVLDLEA